MSNSDKLKIIELGDLITFQRGYDLPKRKLKKGKVPVISSNGIFGYHNEARVSAPGITIGRSGTVGIPHYITEDFFPHNTSLFVKDFKGNNQRFVYYLLKNLNLQSYKSGSGVPTMNRNHLHPLKIRTYTNKKIQKKIANVLSTLDQKIALNHQINTQLEALAKLIYDYWFVQFDFPNASGQPYKSSGGKMVFSEALGREMPEGWEVLQLRDFVLHNEHSISSKTKIDKINYLDTSSLTENKIDSVQVIDLSKDKLPSRAKRIVKNDDILYSTVRPNQLHYGIVKSGMKNLIASTGFVQLRSTDAYFTNDLLYLFLTSSYNTNRLQQIAELSVSAYPSISHNDLLDLYIPLPKNKEVLKEISQLANQFHIKMTNNYLQNHHLTALRDWLLPLLMNGQVRVE